MLTGSQHRGLWPSVFHLLPLGALCCSLEDPDKEEHVFQMLSGGSASKVLCSQRVSFSVQSFHLIQV